MNCSSPVTNGMVLGDRWVIVESLSQSSRNRCQVSSDPTSWQATWQMTHQHKMFQAIKRGHIPRIPWFFGYSLGLECSRRLPASGLLACSEGGNGNW